MFDDIQIKGMKVASVALSSEVCESRVEFDDIGDWLECNADTLSTRTDLCNYNFEELESHGTDGVYGPRFASEHIIWLGYKSDVMNVFAFEETKGFQEAVPLIRNIISKAWEQGYEWLRISLMED